MKKILSVVGILAVLGTGAFASEKYRVNFDCNSNEANYFKQNSEIYYTYELEDRKINFYKNDSNMKEILFKDGTNLCSVALTKEEMENYNLKELGGFLLTSIAGGAIVGGAGGAIISLALNLFLIVF